MFSSENLRADLRALEKLSKNIKSWVDENGLFLDFYSPNANFASVGSLDLIRSVHYRLLFVLSMVLKVLDTLPSRKANSQVGSPLQWKCIPRMAVLSAPHLASLLWAQTCEWREIKLRGGCICDDSDSSLPHASDSNLSFGVGSSPPTPPLRDNACQTEESCLARCESCITAEATIKTVVDIFSRSMSKSTVASERCRVSGRLSWLSQWGAMRALTGAILTDMEALRRQAVELRELQERLQAQEEQQLQQRAEAAEARALAAQEEARLAQEAAAERAAIVHLKDVAEAKLTEAIHLDSVRLQRLAKLEGELDCARLRATDMEARLEDVKQEAGALREERSELQRQLNFAEESQALLLRYPDLHGPLPPPQNDAGDPVLDMECQVRANDLRVSLLTSQNERLKATIEKLRVLTASGRPPTRGHSSSRPTSSCSSTSAARVGQQGSPTPNQ